MYARHDHPAIVHDLVGLDPTMEIPAYFPIPPIPNWMGPNHMKFTRGQQGILIFLDVWHWRWSPSMHDIARGVGRSIKGTYKTLVGLRRLGIIDWVKGQDRTLHLTINGMAMLKLHIGPTRLPGAVGLSAYQISETTHEGDAYGYQKFIARRRLRIYRQERRGRRIPPSMMRAHQTTQHLAIVYNKLHKCNQPHVLAHALPPKDML